MILMKSRVSSNCVHVGKQRDLISSSTYLSSLWEKQNWGEGKMGNKYFNISNTPMDTLHCRMHVY